MMDRSVLPVQVAPTARSPPPSESSAARVEEAEVSTPHPLNQISRTHVERLDRHGGSLEEQGPFDRPSSLLRAERSLCKPPAVNP